MKVPLQPSQGDVIINRSPTSYTVAMSPFPPSVRCRTFDEAIERAGTYASQRFVVYHEIGLDYAFLPVSNDLGDSHRFGLNFSF
jgi:hypothetical protein